MVDGIKLSQFFTTGGKRLLASSMMGAALKIKLTALHSRITGRFIINDAPGYAW